MSKPGQQFGIGQQASMTPQLQQAFRLLQLPALELQAQVEQALDANVMLESDEEFDATWALDSELNGLTGRARARRGRWRAGAPDAPGGTLHDHLAWQLELTPLPNGPRAIGRALIGAIK